jgi:hypothetical protein
MLPDLPNFKGRMEEAFLDFFRQSVSSKLGVFSEAPKHTVHEGAAMDIERADGSAETTDFQSASAEWIIERSSIPDLTLQERLEKLSRATDQMAADMGKHLFGSLDRSLQAAGRTVDGGGGSFDVESIFRGFESVDWEFKPDGKPSFPTIVIPPELRARASEAVRRMDSEEPLKRRLAELIERKRLDWREREASRKLA